MTTESVPRLAVVRALLVVSGGPVALALGGLLAPISAARKWPERLSSPPARRAAWTVTSAATLTPWVYALLLRPWLRRWGASQAERTASYPGDIERPLFTTTRAVTVHAPAHEVWSWLVQIGRDRGGFYSYDWLENLAGCRLRSASRVHPEWQHLDAGDSLEVFPGYATTIEAIDPPRSMLIANWGAYVVEPVTPHTCRLIARSHAERGLAGAAYILFIELPHAIMERRMLLGIKERAEVARHRTRDSLA
ncbi:hypothetical protein [Nocardioides gilvus]|uniref:hypothetical protein n=1 Tax=Nocardioides gilvus TaxID=1735589 RepID=UPI000D741382|nr:hypothetical protein [Nocardioides gilvus]